MNSTQQILDHIRATTPKGVRNRRRGNRFLRLSGIALAVIITLAVLISKRAVP